MCCHYPWLSVAMWPDGWELGWQELLGYTMVGLSCTQHLPFDASLRANSVMVSHIEAPQKEWQLSVPTWLWPRYARIWVTIAQTGLLLCDLRQGKWYVYPRCVWGTLRWKRKYVWSGTLTLKNVNPRARLQVTQLDFRVFGADWKFRDKDSWTRRVRGTAINALKHLLCHVGLHFRKAIYTTL